MRSSRVTPNTVATPNSYNALVADALGAGSLLVHQMYGTIALPTNPSNDQTLTLDINGNNIVITFVSAIGSTAGNVLIGATPAATVSNLIQLLLNPTITNATQVALGVNTAAAVTLVNYINWSASGTNIVASSLNTSLTAPATSFSASTTATGGSYTANTMVLYVEPGVVYVNGTRIIFAGGVSPTVTAPVSHPRIDVLTVDNTGTLAWTTGTEASSPVAPAYPADKVALCELYNVVNETALYDNANQQSGQGYISNDVRPFLGERMNWTAFASDLIPDTTNTRNLGSSGTVWNNVYCHTLTVNGASPAISKFGGSGTSGALSISSGTTTVSASSAAYFELNYTSVSITGTAALTFSNPNTNGTLFVVRSQENVTLTSSATALINVSGLGAAGGAASAGGTASGNPGSNGNAYFLYPTNGGVAATTGSAGTGGLVPTAITPIAPYTSLLPLRYGQSLWVSAGGSSASSSNTSNPSGAGAGGSGSGSLVIECGGALNFTGTIQAEGTSGANGNATYGGGGGGGAGGLVLVAYAALTANTGTITVTGGSGGTGSSFGSGGGGGASAYTAGGDGTHGGSGAGGAGGNGASLVIANTEYA